MDPVPNTELAAYTTIEPTKLHQDVHQPSPYYLPYSGDPEAMLTQTRINMALDAGCDPNGPLLRHIASTSPQQQTLPRKTRASALANSPCSVPVKESFHKGRMPKTPSKHADGSYIPLDPALGASGSPSSISPSKRSGRGAGRTSRAWNPAEKTAQQALQDFRKPASSLGGVMGYSGDVKVQRQVGKARGGEFREDSLLVGMRFVVV